MIDKKLKEIVLELECFFETDPITPIFVQNYRNNLSERYKDDLISLKIKKGKDQFEQTLANLYTKFRDIKKDQYISDPDYRNGIQKYALKGISNLKKEM